MFSTVLFSVTLSPTKPHITPSGLRKSFCGSVINTAVFSRFTLNHGASPLVRLVWVAWIGYVLSNAAT